MSAAPGLDSIIGAIDDLHRLDPAGAELGYAERMSHWLAVLDTDPDPALAIAVRAQHLKRWECPRTDYPSGRSGYLRWRRDAARHHAGVVKDLLAGAGCDEALIERVGILVEKRGADSDGQTLEDCACLVFLENRLAEFKVEHEPPQVERILERTWKKMSPAARELAARLPQG